QTSRRSRRRIFPINRMSLLPGTVPRAATWLRPLFMQDCSPLLYRYPPTVTRPSIRLFDGICAHIHPIPLLLEDGLSAAQRRGCPLFLQASSHGDMKTLTGTSTMPLAIGNSSPLTPRSSAAE